jgi:prepilin-type N-terminal cleavage/methylation domain-containing protein
MLKLPDSTRRKPPARGFTLVEILTVVAIVSLFAVLVLAGMREARQSARDSKRIADMRQFAKALEYYYDATGHYPVSATTTQCARNGNWVGDNGDYSWSNPYMGFQPRDSVEYCLPPEQAYVYASNGGSYYLEVQLENVKDPTTGQGQHVSFDGTAFKKDLAKFSVTFSSPSGPATNQAPIPVTVTFSAPVISFSQVSLFVQNAVIGSFMQLFDTVFSFILNPQSDGQVQVGLQEGVLQTDYGAVNEGGSISIEYDSQRPHLALSPSPLPVTVAGPFEVTLNSTIALEGLGAGDISVTNASVSNLHTIAPFDGKNYAFTVTPLAAGSVTIVIPDGAAHSPAGNTNVVSNTLYTSY